MENVYYMMHPALGLTAVVYAPSTEKARTTFLDWLERNGHIRREDRHTYRRGLVTERIDDPNTPADVVLHYGYRDVGPVVRPTQVPEHVQKQELQYLAAEREVGGEQEVSYVPEEDVEDKPSIEIGEAALSPKRMPIQEVMLRGYG